MTNAIRVAALAMMAVAWADRAIAAPITIDFDLLAAGTNVTTQYQGTGVVFTSIGGVFIVAPGQAVSNPNSATFYNPADTTQVSSVIADFYDPVSGLHSATDYVEFTPTDSSNVGNGFTMSAYDQFGNLLGSAGTPVASTGVYDPFFEDFPIALNMPGIWRVVMSGSVAGGNFAIEGDDFRFNLPAEATEEMLVPEPASGLLLLAGSAALARRAQRRRRR